MSKYIMEAENVKKYFPIKGGLFSKIVGYVKLLWESLDAEKLPLGELFSNYWNLMMAGYSLKIKIWPR